jgi:hypothetical protein
VSCPFLPLSP